jgi:hypothetical protein
MKKYSILVILLASVSGAFDAGNGYFTENKGQWDEQVLYYSCLNGAGLLLTPDAVVMQYCSEQSSGSSIDNPPISLGSTLTGISPELRVIGVGELPHRTSFFMGNIPEDWTTGVPSYSEVVFESVYPNIDMLVHFEGASLRCDFMVHPGGDPSDIVLSHENPELIQPNASGGFIVESADEAPHNQNFAAPELEYSTYVGGTVEDRSYSIEVDDSGSVYVTGRTSSLNYPLQNPFQSSFGGGTWDAFVTKFSPDGSQLVYSTYIGGSQDENGYGVKVDSEGCAYVTGPTESTDFPVWNPLQPALQGTSDAFVLKLSAAGDSLIYSTYMGGSGTERGRDIAVDDQGRAYVIGNTSSADFPVNNPFQSAYGGGIQDSYIFRLSASGAQLEYSTWLGGSSEELGEGVHVDPDGSAYLTGETSSSDFPVNSAYQATYGGGASDAFLAKFTPSGTQVSFSTYLGGSGEDWSSNVSADGSGVSVAGYTASTNFPVKNAFQGSLSGAGSAFVTKFSSGGGTLVFSTYLGGTGSDQGRDIAVDPFGSIYVTGYTSSTDFPTVNAYQSAYAGGINDCFAVKFYPDGQQLDYSTYLGGSGNDSSRGIIVDSSGRAYLTGGIASTDFPMVNPYQGTFGGGATDYFMAKLGPFFTGLEGHSDPSFEQLGIQSLFPNPFSGSFTVNVTVPVSGPLEVTLHDFSGRLVSVVSNQNNVPGGIYSIEWNNRELPSGIYLLRAWSPGCEPALIKVVCL